MKVKNKMNSIKNLMIQKKLTSIKSIDPGEVDQQRSLLNDL